MSNKKTFGEYLRTKRTESDLTQKGLADKLYVTESAVSKWERGLSYPDITLITDLCEILGVSEHELLTASEDTETRNYEKLAKRYISILNGLKFSQYFIYGITLITCFIVDLAVNRLSWFFIVLAGIAVSASLTLLPILVRENRWPITLGGFTATLTALLAVVCVYTGGDWFFLVFVSVIFGLSALFLPSILNTLWLPAPLNSNKALLYFIVNAALLYLTLWVSNAYNGGDWFFSMACPIAGFSLILPLGFILIIRYARINGYFKTAGCLGLSAIFTITLNAVISMILGEPYYFGFDFNFKEWNINTVNGNVNAIIFFSFLLTAVIFVIAGIMREREMRR